MAGPGVRALVGARVSLAKDVDVKTSHLVQRETGEKYASENGLTVVGYFEDINVSAGDVTPFDRPELKPWLNEKLGEWDALILTKSDRLFRNNFDCAQMMKWMKEHQKMMVLVDDGIKVDYRIGSVTADQGFQEAMLIIGALFGTMELDRIKARAKDTRNYLNTTTRWAGGPPPYGYKIIDHPEGGKALAIDKEAAGAIRFAAGKVIAGLSVNETAGLMTSNGIKTPSNHYRNPEKQVNPTKTDWTSTQLGRILKSPNIMGIKVTKGGGSKVGVALRGEDGLPIQIADPILTDEQWNALQTRLKVRSINRERTRSTAPLLGVAYCAGCGNRLYRNTGGDNKAVTYYRCQKTVSNPGCGAGWNFRAEKIQALVDGVMMSELENVPYPEFEWHKGSDTSEALDNVKKAIANLRDEWDSGAYDQDDEDERADYLSRLKRLQEKKKAYADQPYDPARWIEKDTGMTYAEKYNSFDDPDAKRLFLLELDFKIYMGPGQYTSAVVVPPDLAERAKRYGVHLGTGRVAPVDLEAAVG